LAMSDSLTLLSILAALFFSSYGAHRALHSFPTRRSSDLAAPWSGGGARHRRINPSLSPSRRRAGCTPPDFRHLCDQSGAWARRRSEEHTSELQSRENLVCRLLLEKKKQKHRNKHQQTCTN